MRNITLTADSSVIDAARERAASENTTLNAEFRRWLETYARQYRAASAMGSVRELQARYGTGGRRFSRDELNER